MRTGIVVVGVALMIFGIGLALFAYISGWFGGLYGVLIVAGPLAVVGLIVLVIGLVTGRRPRAMVMPFPSAGSGAICPRCGGGLPYVAGSIRCPYCGQKVMPMTSPPVAYPSMPRAQPVPQQPVFTQTRSHFCRFCGMPLHPSSFFCQHCGRNLTI
jgi:DNA-directed RNA polymerase subunit RPC12/RpoP